MSARPILSNRAARRVFLARHGLAEPPVGPSRGAPLLGVIHRLGFVQVDSINTVERAHHMILHARRTSYRPAHLRPLLERDRSLFEHWTHDAAIIPTEFYPHWRLRFDRDSEALKARWKNWRRDGFEERFEEVLTQISQHGPAGSSDVGEGEARGSGGWWDWHPSKTALEYLWRSGQLCVTRREAFRKVYDLTENVLPEALRAPAPSPEATIAWACGSALDRLGFATSGEIAAFWAKVTPTEARDWCARELDKGSLVEIDVEGANGTPRRALARPDLIETGDPPEPPGMIRILSPFDPALRDRNRAERLFGFHYRIEVFVPAAKRQYGYYVFPVLEGDSLIGRIDMKCDRATGVLNVSAFWPEPEVTLGKMRMQKLEAALDRTARFAGIGNVAYLDGWRRDQRQ
ncbi:MAG: crosslink repair DNA glycosylase YcaQ family protein [Paracoccaceae bacterium]